MATTTTPAAYIFKADMYCPGCIVGAMVSTQGFKGWGLAGGITMPVEENLDEIAAAFAIDRDDETSFDSDEFPKVVFADQVGDHQCGCCGEVL